MKAARCHRCNALIIRKYVMVVEEIYDKDEGVWIDIGEEGEFNNGSETYAACSSATCGIAADANDATQEV